MPTRDELREREYVAALQELSRKMWHLRARIRAAQAHFETLTADQPGLTEALRKAWRHLDYLVAAAYELACSPWPGKIPCPHCGAPPEIFGHNHRRPSGGGYVVAIPVHVHYDKRECEDPPPQAHR